MHAIQKAEQFGTWQCKKFRSRIFNRHYAISGELARGFLRNAKSASALQYVAVVDSNANGNRWLRAVDAKLSMHGEGSRSIVLDADDVDNMAKVIALNTKRAIDALLLKGDFTKAIDAVRQRIATYGLPWEEEDIAPTAKNKAKKEEKKRDEQWKKLVRACDPIWWRHQLRTWYRRKVEGVLREAGSVSKRTAPYVSDWALQQWRCSQVANREILAGLFAESDQGDQLSLLECSDASVSNPVNRRNELMVRVRGMEEVAQALDLTGLLLTLTAPSKYHAYHVTGEENQKFNGATPREVMNYLNGVWARIRSEWQRNDIKAYGLRVAEPHHDGTPHFHFLLFVSENQSIYAWQIFEEHAMREDGDERGAREHRCDCVRIDPKKGSAAGYVAKYIAKNIDGYGFKEAEADNEAGVPAITGALRARAWASIWGVRQFQQVGSVSVTVYRELRRLDIASLLEPEEVQACIAAADAGDWAAFTHAMGGAWIKRKEQLLKPLYQLTQKTGKYGEALQKILGVALRKYLAGYKIEFCENYQLISRIKIWVVRPDWELAQRRKRKVIEQIDSARIAA